MLESIRTLTDAANTGRPWDREHYPRLDEGNLDTVDLFCVEHMAIHAARDAGVLAGIVERAPHMPQPFTLSDDQRATAMRIGMKLVVIGLRLFSRMGGTPEDLARYIRHEKQPTSS